MKHMTKILILLLVVALLTLPVSAAYDGPYLAGFLDSPGGMAVVFVLAALLIAGGITGALWAQMNNVHTKTSANHYTVKNSLNVTHQYEKLIRRTKTRRKIEQNKD